MEFRIWKKILVTLDSGWLWGGVFLFAMLPAPIDVEFDEIIPLLDDALLLEADNWFKPMEEPCLEWTGSFDGICKC